MKSFQEFLRESKLTFKSNDLKSWEAQAENMKLVVRKATDSEGESGKYYTAKDKQGNTRGEFSVGKGGYIKEENSTDVIEEKTYTTKDLLAAYKKNQEAEDAWSKSEDLNDYGKSLSAKRAAVTRTNSTVGKIIKALYGNDIFRNVEIRTILQNGGKLPTPDK